jgi:hypothetical protein
VTTSPRSSTLSEHGTRGGTQGHITSLAGGTPRGTPGDNPFVLRLRKRSGLLLALLLLAATASPVHAGDETCYPIEVSDYSPTGIAGCTIDGPNAGKASWYPGVVAAANWCTWPFDGCGAVAVQSHATGLVITIAVQSFCDCYTGTDHERLIDLTRNQVIALGLDPDDGIFAVTVTPLRVDEGIPDTAMEKP